MRRGVWTALCVLILTMFACPALAQEGLGGSVDLVGVEGIWLGGEVGSTNEAVLYVKGTNVTLVDRHNVFVGTWDLKEQTVTPEGATFEVDATFAGIFYHGGQPVGLDFPATTKGLVGLQAGELIVCANEPSVDAPRPEALEPDMTAPGKPRCYRFKRPENETEACVRECIQRNMMRAVPPQVIEEECKQSCEKKKTEPSDP